MGGSDERTDALVMIFLYDNEFCRNESPPSPCSFFNSRIKQGKTALNQTLSGRSCSRMDLKVRFLIYSSSKKPAEAVTSRKAAFKALTSGVNNSGLSSSYFKSASGSLKSAVGGPNRWEGLPYRGPCGPFNVSWTALGLLTHSDGAGPCRISFDVCFRAVKNVRGCPRKQS